MFETIRKIRQTCRKAINKYRKIKDEMQRQRVLNEMEEEGLLYCN